MTKRQARRARRYLALAKRAVLWVQNMFESPLMKQQCASIREDIIELRQDLHGWGGDE